MTLSKLSGTIRRTLFLTLLASFLFAGCSQKSQTLKICFSPYMEPESIMTNTAPMAEMIKAQMENHGFKLDKVELSVGTSYEAVGEALAAGTVDAGFISGGTYVLFDEEVDVILTALRSAINKDSPDPRDWNDGTIEKETGDYATGYRSILLAGPSPKGKALQEKVARGEALTWEDLNSATWAVMSPASASGYQYPSLWLQKNYGKSISDLKNAIRSDSYTTSVARLASQQADILVSYGHIRIKNAPKWEGFGGTAPMAEQTGFIGITDPVYNDTISVSKKSKLMANKKFRDAFAQSMIEIGQSETGRIIIEATFSQKGYVPATSSDYDNERLVQAQIRK